MLDNFTLFHQAYLSSTSPHLIIGFSNYDVTISILHSDMLEKKLQIIAICQEIQFVRNESVVTFHLIVWEKQVELDPGTTTEGN